DTFADALNLGRRTRLRMAARIHDRVGFPVEEFELVRMAPYAGDSPLLVAHDTADRYLPYRDSVSLVEQWPGDAKLLTTEGLGHNRLLRDPGAIAAIVDFVGNDDGPQNPRRAEQKTL
ncbi:MAG: hypothetical protein K0S98_2368, partial [Propionibacteriaceae bacterium]|nr:hypothetical protein [Propionibacteriaceae bacterium]